MTPMSAAPGGGYLTTGQVAAHIGATPQHVRELIHSGALPAIDISKGATRPRFRVLETSVCEFLRTAAVVPTPAAESELAS